MSYKIVTDSCANLPDEIYDNLDIQVIGMEFIIDGEPHLSYVKGRDNNLQKYYKLLREDTVITTTCINKETYTKFFEKILETDDVLYLGFSSGLSLSYGNCLVAAEELRAKYPNSKIYTVDTLAASMGQGMIVHRAAELKNQGKNIEEVRDWVEANKLKICHWFTVEDLKYLYRGGRVSKIGFILGKITQIKPVLFTDNAGHLIPVQKVIGRRKSLEVMAEKIVTTIVNPSEQTVFISHGDCIEDAQKLADLVAQKIKVKGFLINQIDPVIGCHSGPGTLAIFFAAAKR
ncbi:MAG TPA: DegV family protein [Eubacteriales bacterium]|nr:DegV family protein [Eubacteriales bacterium]